VVHDTATYNAFIGRRFGAESARVLRNSSVRVGVINLADRKPPLIPDAAGYSTSVYGSLLQGRTWTLEVTRQF
jgi:outer membrane receptor protein involved in Fe transport